MRIIITGGGTGGHLYPALAIGTAFQKLGAEIHYIGAEKGIEKSVMGQDSFPSDFLPVEGIRNKNLLTLPKGVFHLWDSYNKAKKIIKGFQPDLIIGTGGYASFPVLRAGQSLGIKTMIHEANAEMGKANAALAKKADCLCLTYQSTLASVKDSKNIKITGMPVRESVKTTTREEGSAYLQVEDDVLVVTITGGSQGSHHINEAMAAYYKENKRRENILFYHIAGKNNKEDIAALSGNENVIVKDYEEKMDLVLARTDICIGRGGSSFLTEISIRGIASIIVPYPFSHGHQEKNAAYFKEVGAALMVLDKDLSTLLFPALDSLIKDEGYRNSLGCAMAKEAKGDALERIVEAGLALLK